MTRRGRWLKEATVIRRSPFLCLFLLSESYTRHNTSVIRWPQPAGCAVSLPIPHGH